jgi:hypothetical protein
MAIGSAAHLIANAARVRIAYRFSSSFADETLRLEIENPGVAGVIGSKRPTSPAGGWPDDDEPH